MSKGADDTDPCGDNSVPPCIETFSWPGWNGWFTGWFLEDMNDFMSLVCDYTCDAVAGGTWSAKYNKKLSGAADPQSAVEGKFKTRAIDPSTGDWFE